MKFQKHRNTVPIISLEGSQSETDNRRGNGIYANLEKTFSELNNKNIFWGTSLTVTSRNLSVISEESFINNLFGQGCRLFFFVEYTPTTKDTVELVVTGEQRTCFEERVKYFRNKFAALFVSLPGDEAEFGGCLAAGRGFIHVSATGNVEPCPFVPYSDANLKDVTLKEALKSEFLQKIRERPDELKEGLGGCSLWSKSEWLTSTLLK